jgi:hypothetical protein
MLTSDCTYNKEFALKKLNILLNFRSSLIVFLGGYGLGIYKDSVLTLNIETGNV